MVKLLSKNLMVIKCMKKVIKDEENKGKHQKNKGFIWKKVKG